MAVRTFWTDGALRHVGRSGAGQPASQIAVQIGQGATRSAGDWSVPSVRSTRPKGPGRQPRVRWTRRRATTRRHRQGARENRTGASDSGTPEPPPKPRPDLVHSRPGRHRRRRPSASWSSSNITAATSSTTFGRADVPRHHKYPGSSYPGRSCATRRAWSATNVRSTSSVNWTA